MRQHCKSTLHSKVRATRNNAIHLSARPTWRMVGDREVAEERKRGVAAKTGGNAGVPEGRLQERTFPTRSRSLTPHTGSDRGCRPSRSICPARLVHPIRRTALLLCPSETRSIHRSGVAQAPGCRLDSARHPPAPPSPSRSGFRTTQQPSETSHQIPEPDRQPVIPGPSLTTIVLRPCKRSPPMPFATVLATAQR